MCKKIILILLSVLLIAYVNHHALSQEYVLPYYYLNSIISYNGNLFSYSNSFYPYFSPNYSYLNYPITFSKNFKDKISWTEIINIPQGFADETDDGITEETDPTVEHSVKDGISWEEIANIPPDFADDTDNIGITTEDDPKIASITTNNIPKWNGSQLIDSSSIFEIGNLVSIGTTSSPSRLEVLGSQWLLFLKSLYEGYDAQLTIVNNKGLGGIIAASNNYGDLVFRSFGPWGSRSIMWIENSNGNVGIGTPSPDYNLQVEGSFAATTKGFDISDPRYNNQDKRLIHGSLEGPENGVYYRGESMLIDGVAIIELPDYFESLTRQEDRTVQLTAKNGWSPLYVDGEVEDGEFIVKTTEYGNQEQEFYWEIKAVRADVDLLQAEVIREN